MTATNNSWDNNPNPNHNPYAPPGATAPQQPATMQAPAQMPQGVAAMGAAPAPAAKPLICWEIPESCFDSVHVNPRPGDRFFAMAEPTAAQMRQLAKDEVRFDDTAWRFVKRIGTGSMHAGPDVDAAGAPIMVPDMAPVSTEDAQAWWYRLSHKAQMLVVSEFQSLVVPSEAEGNAMRQSRRRLA